MKAVKNPTRTGTDPVGWLTMWVDLAGEVIYRAPGLVAYTFHPDG